MFRYEVIEVIKLDLFTSITSISLADLYLGLDWPWGLIGFLEIREKTKKVAMRDEQTKLNNGHNKQLLCLVCFVYCANATPEPGEGLGHAHLPWASRAGKKREHVYIQHHKTLSPKSVFVFWNTSHVKFPRCFLPGASFFSVSI